MQAAGHAYAGSAASITIGLGGQVCPAITNGEITELECVGMASDLVTHETTDPMWSGISPLVLTRNDMVSRALTQVWPWRRP